MPGGGRGRPTAWPVPRRVTLGRRRRRTGRRAETGTRGDRVMGLLDEKVAIITGASKGIGRVAAIRFGNEGARVACVARTAEAVKNTAAAVDKAGGRGLAVVADASKEADVQRMVESVVKAFGRVDI